jgi:hypothetical protein
MGLVREPDARGSVMVKLVPSPGRDSTLIVPPRLLNDAVQGGEADPRPTAGRLGGEERLEDARRHLGRHPCSGVAHYERRSLRRAQLGARDTDLDGERPVPMHRVARIHRQVHDHLLELRAVGQHRHRAMRGERDEVQRCAEERSEHRCHLRDNLVEIEHLGAQHLLAAEGEQLRGERSCPVRAPEDLANILAPWIIRRELVLKELGEARDGREDVVEIVSDAAGELAHRFHLLRLAELRLEGASRGDVHDETIGQDASVRLARVARGGSHPSQLARGEDQAALPIPGPELRDRGLPRSVHAGSILRMDQAEERVGIPHDRLWRDAAHRACALAHESEALAAVGEIDELVDDPRNVGRDTLVACLALPERGLGAPPLRDVLELGDEVQRCAERVSHYHHVQLHPDPVPVLVEEALLDATAIDLSVEHSLTALQVPVQIIRMGDRTERVADQLFRGVADDVAERAIHPYPALVRARDRHPDGRVVEGAAEALLALAQRRDRGER